MSHSKSTLRRRVIALVASLTLAVSALPASADSHTEVITPDTSSVAKGSSGSAIAGLEVAGFDGGGPVFVSVSVPSGDLGATAGGAASATDGGDLLRVSGSETDTNPPWPHSRSRPMRV